MRFTEPEVFLVARPEIEWGEVAAYLKRVDPEGKAEGWIERTGTTEDGFQRADEGDLLVEFGGRLCYRSWEPGLNPNVTKIREDSDVYLDNVLASGHGSVLEHANYSFVFHNVSRVFTHELVRHRAGMAYSQESMRFVRLTDIPFWFPEWAREDENLMSRSVTLLKEMEEHQVWMADHFGLDATKECPRCEGDGRDRIRDSMETVDEGVRVGDFIDLSTCPACKGEKVVSAVPFSEKKAKTSFMRRFAPDGVSTGILATGNIRSWRHTIYMRTAAGAEEEIRLVFDVVASMMQNEAPLLFADFTRNDDGEWTTPYIKV